MYVQLDGRLLVAAGHGSAALTLIVRLHPDGSVDRSFTNGNVGLEPAVRVLEPMRVANLTVLPDGKVLVAGSTAYEDPQRGAIIVRLTASGLVDLTYGDYGVARTRLGDGGLPKDVAFQPDGAAVFVGVPVQRETHRRFLLARRLPAGVPISVAAGAFYNVAG